MPTALELGKKGWKPFIGNKRLSPQITDLQIIERDKLLRRSWKISRCSEFYTLIQ
jgi:hypothetical protein